MSRYHHSKSGLFLMELLLNLLLFCVLCGCGLMFFTKSKNLTDSTTSLHHAAAITSSIANIYENGDGTLTAIHNEFEYAAMNDTSIYIYYDEYFNPCSKVDCEYYVLVKQKVTSLDKISIEFYNKKGTMTYSIMSCHFTPTILEKAKEVPIP